MIIEWRGNKGVINIIKRWATLSRGQLIVMGLHCRCRECREKRFWTRSGIETKNRGMETNRSGTESKRRA